MLQTISITVSGKVQGVFYRQFTKEAAMNLGITGRVMNLPDGNVHVLATGTKEQLDKLIAWCRQGPPKAIVTDIKVQDIPLQSFDKFSIQRF